MSFFINDTELKECNFNSQKVSSIYYNNNLVWYSAPSWEPWPGIAEASWEQVYGLCKAKQLGLTDWPSDITIGATREIQFRHHESQSFPHWEVPVVLIGIDVDGPGVLTFMTKYADLYEDVGPKVKASDLYYITFDQKGLFGEPALNPYLRPITKRYKSSLDGVSTHTDVYFKLSTAEMGFKLNSVDNALFTVGVNQPYPYFDDVAKRTMFSSKVLEGYEIETPSVTRNGYIIRPDGKAVTTTQWEQDVEYDYYTMDPLYFFGFAIG